MLPDDLPEDMPSFVARFGSDEQCREYLFKARWPDGFRCSACGHDDAYALRTKIVYECVACRKQHSLLAGTIFEQTKTGLAKWFLAIYLVTSSKGGIAATELKRQLGLGSYQTAWTWLHKLRKAMGRPTASPWPGASRPTRATSAARGPASAAGAPPARPWSAGRSRPAAARPAGAVSAGSGSPRWPTPRPRAWKPSSPPTSPSRRPWPPTAGVATSACRPGATTTSRSTSAPPGATPRSGCLRSTWCLASSSAGSSAPTTARWARSTSPPISTSTRSASTAAPPSGSATASPASSSTPCASSLPATEISSLRQHQPDGHG